MVATPEQVKSAFSMVHAVAEAVREAGEIPSGLVYSAIMDKVDLEGYDKIIALLVRSELVEKTQRHTLKWVGPVIVKE